MADRWVKRRAHCRRLKSGQATNVRESWALYELKAETKRGRYFHLCPVCGTRILSVHMPNGGWAHFEGAKGLTRTKHACLHRGLGWPSGRDELTPDLFEVQQGGL